MIKIKLVLALEILFFWLIQSSGFAAPPLTISTKKTSIIQGGVYAMGSHKSLTELNPFDLFNTDRHALGPENPAHNVEIDGYYIDTYEVTHGSYMEYVKSTNAKKPRFWDDPNFNNPIQPVVGISWKEAQTYCRSKSSRLPTEAEWEKASRGKRAISYPWGNRNPDSTKLNYNGQLNKTAPVGSYELGKSDYGVYDLSGNVSEWTYDWHLAEYYIFSPKTNPLGPKSGQYKVIRGGNWRNKLKEEVNMTYRNATTPSNRSNTLGFRCAKSAGSIPPHEYPSASN